MTLIERLIASANYESPFTVPLLHLRLSAVELSFLGVFASIRVSYSRPFAVAIRVAHLSFVICSGSCWIIREAPPFTFHPAPSHPRPICVYLRLNYLSLASSRRFAFPIRVHSRLLFVSIRGPALPEILFA